VIGAEPPSAKTLREIARKTIESVLTLIPRSVSRRRIFEWPVMVDWSIGQVGATFQRLLTQRENVFKRVLCKRCCRLRMLVADSGVYDLRTASRAIGLISFRGATPALATMAWPCDTQ
jgi:hypothetical protein